MRRTCQGPSRRFNVKIQKLLRQGLLAVDQRKVCLLNFAWRHRREFSAISAIGQYLNETYADLLRGRDKNSAIILRHDHNPAK